MVIRIRSAKEQKVKGGGRGRKLLLRLKRDEIEANLSTFSAGSESLRGKISTERLYFSEVRNAGFQTAARRILDGCENERLTTGGFQGKYRQVNLEYMGVLEQLASKYQVLVIATGCKSNLIH